MLHNRDKKEDEKTKHSIQEIAWENFSSQA